MEKKKSYFKELSHAIVMAGRWQVQSWLIGDSGKCADDVGWSPRVATQKGFLCAIWRQDCFFGKPVYFLRGFNLLEEAHSHYAG